MVITKTDNHLNTSVYRKKTNKGLLLHYQSHVDNRYKRSLIRTMLDRAKCLSSSPDLFSKECYDLRKMFLKLKYPVNLIDSIFMRFHARSEPKLYWAIIWKLSRQNVIREMTSFPYHHDCIKHSKRREITWRIRTLWSVIGAMNRLEGFWAMNAQVIILPKRDLKYKLKLESKSKDHWYKKMEFFFWALA